MLVLALCGLCMKSALQWQAARFVGQEILQTRIILAAALLANMVNSFIPAARAMAADMSDRDAGARSAAFAAMGFALACAIATGFAGGFFILEQHLTSYEHIWLGSMVAGVCITGLAFALLKKTGPSAERESTYKRLREKLTGTSPSPKEKTSVGLGSRICDTCRVYKEIMSDPVLREIILWAGFMSLGNPADHLGRQVLMGPLRYSQAAASMFGIVSPAAYALGTGISAVAVRKIGAYRTLGVATACHILGLLLLAFCLLTGGLAQVTFWMGTIIVSASFGMDAPVVHTIASIHVDEDIQGRLFSLIQVVDVAAAALGIQLFMKKLYDAEWRGMQAGTAFFVSAAVKLLGLLWIWRISKMASKDTNTSESGEEDDTSSSEESCE
eukprot:TRINITY_DN49293_c0_g1_i2.p1 TRINITY_DN49293_c0_g1~~TRINITY_DN49293_c0_g1_i2.p1  ORF type:complete len:385 (-),score=45.23 TRINITY_DN49293_c0_g1_i2:112-1266(-)